MIDDGRRNSPLAGKAFRNTWAGATISSAGDSASWIALVALTLGPLRGNLPLLAVLYTAPVAAGGLMSGWALDRFDPRLVLVADSALRAGVFATLPIASLLGHLTVGLVYLVAAAYGLLKMTSLAGFPVLIPALVPDRLLTQANALEGASFGIASLTGALLAGIAIPTVGPNFVIGCDAVTYVIFAAALLTVRPSYGQAGTTVRRRAAAMNPVRLRAVIAAMWKHPWLRELTVMYALFNVGDGALLVLLPRRAVAVGLGVGGYGWLVASTTAGELLSAAWLVRTHWHPRPATAVVVAQLLAGCTVVGILAGPTLTTIALLFVFGFLTGPMTVWAQTMRMHLITPQARGRTFALLRTAMQATPPLGALLAALAQSDGTFVSIAAVVLVMMLPAALLGPRVAVAPEPKNHAAKPNDPVEDDLMCAPSRESPGA